MQEKNAKAYIMMITSVLIFGTIGIFRKHIPLSSEMLAFSRGLLREYFPAHFYRGDRAQTEKARREEAALAHCDWCDNRAELDAAVRGVQIHHRRHGDDVLLYAADYCYPALAGLFQRKADGEKAHLRGGSRRGDAVRFRHGGAGTARCAGHKGHTLRSWRGGAVCRGHYSEQKGAGGRFVPEDDGAARRCRARERDGLQKARLALI